MSDESLGYVGVFVNRIDRASVHEDPEKMAMETAGLVAFDESIETKSTLSDQD